MNFARNAMKRKLPRFFCEPGFWATGATVLPVIWCSAIGGCALEGQVIAGFFLLLLLLFGSLWLALSRPPWYLLGAARAMFRLRRAGVVALCAGILVSVPVTRWPLRLAFFASRPALDAIADRVERGETFRHPLRAGLFVIEKAEKSDLGSGGTLPQVTCLWMKDFGGYLCGGFVRSPYDYNHYSIFKLSRLAGSWRKFDDE